jgi:hypothetical protein
VENNADAPAPHSALRQLRREFSSPVAWAVLLGIAAILTIAGAFETGDLMPFGPRLAYWVILVAGSYATGTIVGSLVGGPLEQRFGHVPGTLLVGLLVGLAVTVLIAGLNLLSFPDWTPEISDLGALASVVIPVGVIVTYLIRLFERAAAPAAPNVGVPEPKSVVEPRILRRLPLEKRATLLSISVEDHYVRVRTARGEEMLLMRLSDAIAETDPVPGLRVHRSHWVALKAVTAARREGDRAILTIVDGTEIPVSRSNVPGLREEGLLR